MKLSTRARYALRIMLDVARNDGPDKPVSLTGVAKRTGLSRGYLEQLALALRNARLLRAIAGRNGGYRLGKDPAEITVGSIFEAAIGPIFVVDCLEDIESCDRTDSCECRVLYTLLDKGIAAVIHRYTLADLIHPDWLADIGELCPVAAQSGSNKATTKTSRKKR